MTSEPSARLDHIVRGVRTPGCQYVAVGRIDTLFEYANGWADLSTHAPMAQGSTMMAYSMSKTITAAAVLQLVEAGKMTLDDRLARYVTAQPYGDAVTIRQLLSHTSGIPNPIPLRWVHPIEGHGTFDENAALSAVLQRYPRLSFAPGTKYAYSNIGYWLLGVLVERVTGTRFPSYVEQHILAPLGLASHDLGYAIVDRATHATGYLEKYSMLNVIKRFVIDPTLLGEYVGPWLEIRPHYLNGPAFGGLVGSAKAFGRFLQDQLQTRSRLFGEVSTRLFYERQHTVRGEAVPMTLGWHIGSIGKLRFFYKEGSGGGFHSMMRLYLDAGIGTVAMVNATGCNVARLLDDVDMRFVPT